MMRLPKVLIAASAAMIMLPCLSSAQNRKVSDEFEFINYLIGNELPGEAVTFLSQDIFQPSDSLDYLRGWADYNAKKLEEASIQFDKVGSESAFYDKSLFFNVISNAHLGKYDKCQSLLDSYSGPYKELHSVEQAGIALLKGSPEDYLKASSGFTYSKFALTESEEKLSDIYNDRYHTKGKDPLIAAAASAVVPGLGKVYAGELGEGISSFLVVGSMAAITAENWSKHGFTNWKTLLFGTLTAAFYIGNIYGSYVTVSIHNNDIKNAQDTAILYHIHIPLRSSFN